MATEVKLPRLGQGMESGTVVRWLKQEGDRVEKGEPLYELDTEKVTQEVEAEASGVLLQIAVQEGEVPVGQTVAVIGEEGESLPEEDETPDRVQPDEEGAEVGVEKPAEAPAREDERRRGREASADTSEQVTEIREPRRDGRVKASPLARRIARERGVDLAQVRGTGPEGRIVAEDVERAEVAPAPATAAAAGEVEVVPLTSTRRTIARRLTEAWEAPVFQISMSADMTRANELRERLVELAGDGPRPTISDVLTKLTATALIRHRGLNAEFAGDEVRIHPTANMGMAVATDRGLVVPVIRSAERLTIQEIAAARADLVDRARSGKLQQGDLEGGTFTISNLGMFGVESFIAVLNPPQVAILAVGAATEQPVVRDGELTARPLMSLTLTCDHRAVDGADAADFLRTVRTRLEEPGLAL
ncbi:MAG TPA: dihydrolipoamide acetyltransferase family protein [Gaiellaceae bacterium]|jgi:pyruvate dehydrogenase E2 component (dihydrolipoamide acetyltransferase)|nr:dihydrolipoamide acetyltransferase family protein [Gaiellaceae bacterium]